MALYPEWVKVGKSPKLLPHQHGTVCGVGDVDGGGAAGLRLDLASGVSVFTGASGINP
jgi:hypothetical protein